MLATLALAGATSTATARPTATVNVSITAAGFVPDNVRVRPGDMVTWKNNDTASHQVVSDTGVFRSPMLKPGESYSYRFDVESSYSYHDAVKDSSTGAVHVVTTGVTAGVSRIRAVYGSTFEVFGSIPNGATGEQVTVTITPYGSPSTTRTVTTVEGTYSFRYRARIKTEFSASWNGTTSDVAPTVLVRPLVIFNVLNARQNQFRIRVKAARSYARKPVRIQRRSTKWRLGDDEDRPLEQELRGVLHRQLRPRQDEGPRLGRCPPGLRVRLQHDQDRHSVTTGRSAGSLASGALSFTSARRPPASAESRPGARAGP